MEGVFDELSEEIAEYADDIVDTVDKYGDDVVETASKYLDEVSDTTAKHTDDIIEKVQEYVDNAVDVGQTANKVSSTLSDLIQAAKKKYSNMGENLIKHIFSGEINAKGNAVGFHHEGRISDAAGKVVEITKAPNAQGVYEARVMVDGVLKSRTSTFFLKDWTPEQVLAAIQEAFDNRVLKTGKQMQYRGMSKSGIEIEMFVKDGVITSAYPVMY